MRGKFRLSMGRFSTLSIASELRILTLGDHRAINLTKNSQFFVRQGDVERLIAQGFLQKLN